MTILELMTKLTSAETIPAGARIAAECGIAGAKDVYLAWGKERGCAAKILEAAWKEAQPAKQTRKAGGFAADFYAWLAGDARSEQEAHDYIMGVGEYGETTKNTKAHLTHFLNIWALAETVRSGETVMRSFSASKGNTATGNSQKAKKEAEPEQDTSREAELKAAFKAVKEKVRTSQRPRKTWVSPIAADKWQDLVGTKLFAEVQEWIAAFNKQFNKSRTAGK